MLGKYLADGAFYHHSGVDTTTKFNWGVQFINSCSRRNSCTATKVAAISAIDLLKLPSKIARLNVLKTAIKSAFLILFALIIMKEAEVKNIEALEDKFTQPIT